MTNTQDQLIVLPGAESADPSANAAQERAKRRSGSLTSLLLPELQALAASMGIATGKLRKSDLIAAIQNAQRPQGGTNGASQPAPSAAEAAPAASQAPPAARSRRSASRAVTTIEPVAPRQDESPVSNGAATPPAANGAATSPTGNRVSGGNARTTAGTGADSTDRQPERTRTRDGGRYRDGATGRDGQQANGRDTQNRDTQSRDSQNRDTQQANGRDAQNRDSQQANGRDTQNRDSQSRDSQQANGRDTQNRDTQSRDTQSRDTQNRDNQNRDGQNRNAVQSGNRNDRNSGAGSDDDDEYGQGRRPRRYRDRRGRSRDRSEVGSSTGRNDVEPTISEDDVLVPVAGIVDNVDDKGSWFIRVNGYFASSDDVYVANSHVRRYNLRRGDAVTGAVRQAREGERKEKFNPLVRLDTINGVDPERARSRVEFTKLTPLYPQQRLRLETEPHILTTRVIDLVMPIGKGQRALIVSPPKAGKTMIMQAIANAIATNNPECHLMVVLIDERPEEVTDMQRSVKGEVIASTFDRRPQDHTMVAELSIERAKRLVEMGHDVVVLLDSITRLGRAYNLAAPASGRILSGGVDSTALYPPKRFLGAARNIEDGGSLTIIASALVETGSAGDTVIFEEFKGTGNAELRLDRKIADKRVFPAVDVDQSSTRKEEILLSPDELAVVIKLRRVLHALDPQQGIDLLLDRLRKTRTNIEFLMQIAKTTPGADDR